MRARQGEEHQLQLYLHAEGEKSWRRVVGSR
jgi:hypothetical protein